MKFLHTSDWHVGKTLKGRNRLEEQRAVLAEIATVARRTRSTPCSSPATSTRTSAPTADAQSSSCRP